MKKKPMNKKQKEQLSRREFNSIMLRAVAFSGAVGLVGTGCALPGGWKLQPWYSSGSSHGTKWKAGGLELTKPLGGGGTSTNNFSWAQMDSIMPSTPAGATSWYEVWMNQVGSPPPSSFAISNTSFVPSGYTGWREWNNDPEYAPPSGYSTWSAWIAAK